MAKKTAILPPIEKFKGMLCDFSKITPITAHSGILTISERQKSSLGV